MNKELLKFDKEGVIELPSEVKEYLNIIVSGGDVTTFMKQNPDVISKFNQMTHDYRRIIEPFMMLKLFAIDMLPMYNKFFDSNVSDIFYTKAVLSEMNYSSSSIHDIVLHEVVNYVKNDLFKSMILAENRRLQENEEKKLNFENNLINTDHLKDVKDVELILNEILSPHKGKVVYFDFWGSWCVPCLEEMSFAPQVKKALKDKDVVFVYLANNTSQDAWKNFIKTKDLEGENVIHYNLPSEQQGLVERRLGVRSFPTYMLFNKEGELVNSQAPRPSQLDQLKKEIEKLL